MPLSSFLPPKHFVLRSQRVCASSPLPESRFAHVLDNFQPFLLNAESDGKSWKEHGASDANIYTRNPKTAETAPEIWACMQEKIRSAIERGILVHEDKATGKK